MRQLSETTTRRGELPHHLRPTVSSKPVKAIDRAIKVKAKAITTSKTKQAALTEVIKGSRDGKTGIFDSNSCTICTEHSRRTTSEALTSRIARNMSGSLGKA